MRQQKSTSELGMGNHYRAPTIVGIFLIISIGGCAPARPDLVSLSVDGMGASTLPPPISTSTAINTPTALQMGESLSLPALLEEHELELWDVAGEAHPITAEILNNEATYGAVLDELQATLQRAEDDVRAIEAGGGTVFVELRWNGASSYSNTTEIEVFYRECNFIDESDACRGMTVSGWAPSASAEHSHLNEWRHPSGVSYFIANIFSISYSRTKQLSTAVWL